MSGADAPGVQLFGSFDGCRIAYRVYGAGPDVVLLHGFAADHVRNWVQPGVVDALVRAGRRVIAYDARGHGLSDKPHDVDAYEHDAMVRDARALLDHLGVQSVDVVGYSMGSVVSSRLVPVEPRTRALVLGGVGGRLGRSLESRARTAAVLQRRAARAGSRPVDRAFLRFAQRSGNDLDALAAVQRAAAAGTPGDVAAITVPALVVAGADDRLAGSPHDLAARLAHGRGVVVPGNHLTALRPPFVSVIVAFLDEVSPVR